MQFYLRITSVGWNTLIFTSHSADPQSISFNMSSRLQISVQISSTVLRESFILLLQNNYKEDDGTSGCLQFFIEKL